MIVKLTKGTRSYYAAPYTFTEKDPVQEVSEELGKHLLNTGYFIEIEEIKPGTTENEKAVSGEKGTQDKAEEAASKQKELYEEGKEEIKNKESKKKSTKKEDKR